MNNPETGGPAFPSHGSMGEVVCEGMTLRQYAAIKLKVKQATQFVDDFEGIVTKYAASKDCGGVICGHIHTPTVMSRNDVTYYNTGDWVESCTAVVEHFDGRMEIIRFTELAAMPNAAAERFVPVVVESNAAAA